MSRQIGLVPRLYAPGPSWGLEHIVLTPGQGSLPRNCCHWLWLLWWGEEVGQPGRISQLTISLQLGEGDVVAEGGGGGVSLPAPEWGEQPHGQRQRGAGRLAAAEDTQLLLTPLHGAGHMAGHRVLHLHLQPSHGPHLWLFGRRRVQLAVQGPWSPGTPPAPCCQNSGMDKTRQY